MWAFRFTNSNAHAHPPESEVSGLVAGHTRPSFPPTYDIRQIDKIQSSCYVANAWSNWAAKHARLSLTRPSSGAPAVPPSPQSAQRYW